jgi:hypothetical protein
MNVYEYCKFNKLDISKLSKKSMEALGGMYLENINPTQDRINRLAKFDAGIFSPEVALLTALNSHTITKGCSL